MELGPIVTQLPLVYILVMAFYGMLFAFGEVNRRVEPSRRFTIIIALILANLLTGNLIFLLIGSYGAAWKMTIRQQRKNNE